MDHPEYLSPLEKFLRSIFLHILSAAGICADQTKWVVTGTAAILGLIIANLNSVREVVSSSALKYGICLLTTSMMVGVLIVLLALAIKHAVLVAQAFQQQLASPEGKASVEGINASPEELNAAICEPFYGPIKTYIRKSADSGVKDFLSVEKRNVRTMCTICYLSIIQGLLAASGLVVLALGIK